MVGNARWSLAPQQQQQGLNLGGQPDPNAAYQMPQVPWAQNPMITTAALGLLGGRTLNEGLQNVAQNAPAGLAAKTAMQRDMYSIQEKNAERARQTAAMNAGIKQMSGQPLTPEEQAAYAGSPEIALKFFELSQKSPTDDITEYKFAQSQGFTGTFEDWDTARRAAGAQHITVGGGKYGTIPPGFELVEGPNGATMRPIPGGPADPTKTDTKKRAGEVQKADIVTQDIDRVLKTTKRIPTWTTGFFGNILSNVGGTGAGNVSELLSGIKANVGFGQLQNMREASPTGAALGPVSDAENALLQSVLGSVEQSQGQEQLEFNLKRLKNVYLDTIHGEGNGPPREVLDEDGSSWSEPEPGVRIREKP